MSPTEVPGTARSIWPPWQSLWDCLCGGGHMGPFRGIYTSTRTGPGTGPYTYLRLKQLKFGSGLFPGCQNSGTLCLNSVAEAVFGLRANPASAQVEGMRHRQEVPEFALKARIPPLVPSPLF